MTLTEKLEAADGPDRELDCEIALGQGYITRPNRGYPDQLDYGQIDEDGSTCFEAFDMSVRRYTASIEAALTLVPEGYYPAIGQDGSEGAWYCHVQNSAEIWSARAKTPALAICIAARKARGDAG